MKENEFLSEMQDILDTEKTLTMETGLGDCEAWDSIAYVTFLADMSDYTEKKISPQEVRTAVTVGDLYHLAFD